MPRGYKCDRCEEFVEERQPTFWQDSGPGGHPVEQVVVHPPTDSDDEFSQNAYSLCDDCREELIEWVERGTLTASFKSVSTGCVENVGFSLAFEPYQDDLTDIGGVGDGKAKFLKDAGYTSKNDLRGATQAEIADVNGISNVLAARIKADVGGVGVDE